MGAATMGEVYLCQGATVGIDQLQVVVLALKQDLGAIRGPVHAAARMGVGLAVGRDPAQAGAICVFHVERARPATGGRVLQRGVTDSAELRPPCFPWVKGLPWCGVV
jgi:hypothetical protein